MKKEIVRKTNGRAEAEGVYSALIMLLLEPPIEAAPRLDL